MHSRKAASAELAWERTTVSLGWLAEGLELLSAANASQILRRSDWKAVALAPIFTKSLELRQKIPILPVKIARFAVLILITICLSGCPRKLTVILFNNTKKIIIIQKEDRNFPLQPHTSSEIEISLDLNVNLSVSGSVWRYRMFLPQPDSIYLKYSGTQDVFKFQIEEDCRIYAVSKDENFPAKNLAVQPPNFPIDKKDTEKR